MEKLVHLLEKRDRTRIVAFGSSNTDLGQHAEGHFNWFNWLDVGLATHVGKKHAAINSGISGNTCAELLGRFELDCAIFQPNIVIITIGGNDSNPERKITAEMFKKDLKELVARVKNLPECIPVLQTYYSFDIEKLPAGEKE